MGQTSVPAILSLVFAFIFAPAGLILGIYSLSTFKKNPGLKGKGLAMAGTIISAIFLAISALLILVSLFALGGAQSSAEDAAVTAEVNQIRSGLESYRNTNGGYPLAPADGLFVDGTLSDSGFSSAPTGTTYFDMPYASLHSVYTYTTPGCSAAPCPTYVINFGINRTATPNGIQ